MLKYQISKRTSNSVGSLDVLLRTFQLISGGARLLISALFIGLVTGCAANMAATGQNGPDIEVASQETTRQEVERQLGSPKEVKKLKNGHFLAIYNIQASTEPNLLRAAGHGTMDLFTIGLWEIVGGPMEAYIGRRILVTAEYDRQNNLIALDSKPQEFF